MYQVINGLQVWVKSQSSYDYEGDSQLSKSKSMELAEFEVFFFPPLSNAGIMM